MTNTDHVSIVLGDEFDDALRSRLLSMLQALDARVVGPERRAIGGSQELEELDVLVNGQLLHVEAETYMGLSITGPAELVRLIQQKIVS